MRLRRWSVGYVAVFAVALLLAGAIALVALDDEDDDRWIVTGRTADYEHADASCSELPGVEDRRFSSTSDLPPGTPSEGIYYAVEGLENAEDVRECFEDNGVIDPVVEVEQPPSSFENVGP